MEISGETDKDVIQKQFQAMQKQSRDVLQRLMKSGITIVSGSDDYLDLNMPQGQGAKRVLYAYAECGMSVLDILRTTSINAARHLRLENRIGVIKPGSFADIIAVEGNLEKDIRVLDNVRFVMKDGAVYVGPSGNPRERRAFRGTEDRLRSAVRAPHRLSSARPFFRNSTAFSRISSRPLRMPSIVGSTRMWGWMPVR